VSRLPNSRPNAAVDLLLHHLPVLVT
jgi:hypothetical protein